MSDEHPLFSHDDDIDVVSDPRAGLRALRLAAKLLGRRLNEYAQLLVTTGRNRETAKGRKAARLARDGAIADLARAAAKKSDALALNPKKLTAYVVQHWDATWGDMPPNPKGRVYKILSEQGVLRELKRPARPD